MKFKIDDKVRFKYNKNLDAFGMRHNYLKLLDNKIFKISQYDYGNAYKFDTELEINGYLANAYWYPEWFLIKAKIDDFDKQLKELIST